MITLILLIPSYFYTKQVTDTERIRIEVQWKRYKRRTRTTPLPFLFLDEQLFVFSRSSKVTVTKVQGIRLYLWINSTIVSVLQNRTKRYHHQSLGTEAKESFLNPPTHFIQTGPNLSSIVANSIQNFSYSFKYSFSISNLIGTKRYLVPGV